MKTNQKTKNTLWSMLALAMLSLNLSSAHAAILEGHFKKDGVHAFVKVTDGNAYGMIWVDDNTQSSISLYRIEEQDDGSEAWIKLVVNASQMIGNNVSSEADYTGTVIERDSNYLSLSPTEFGRQNGSGNRFVLRESDEYSWLDLPAATAVYDSKGETRAERRSNTISKHKVQGTFEVAGQSYNGDFVVRSPIPLVGTLHSKELSAENESGRRISRQIISFVIRLKERCAFEHEHIVFFKLGTPGKIEFNRIIN